MLPPQPSSVPLFSRSCGITVILALLLPVTINAAPPAAPSNFTGISLKPREVLFTWQDNSEDEDGFEFFIDQNNNGVWISIGITAPDTTSISISGFPVGITTGVRINAVNPDGASEFSETYLARLFDASVTTGQPCLRVEIGDAVSVPVNLLGFEQPDINVRPLPEGLSYDPAARSISGTVTSSGYFQSTITATENGNQRKASIGIAVIDIGVKPLAGAVLLLLIMLVVILLLSLLLSLLLLLLLLLL